MPPGLQMSMLRRLAQREVARGGGRVRRPAGGSSVDIAYVRQQRGNGVPIVVIPGGPGLASALPYRGLRSAAAKAGLDVVMVEHRGVGLSRFDITGAALPLAAVTIAEAVDDIAAVLDDAGIDRAIIVGSSYGTYLAQLFGVRHPTRVAAMVLDSPILSVDDDLATTRAYRRELLVDGPGALPEAVRELIASDEVSPASLNNVVTAVYEMTGPEPLRRLVTARARGRGRMIWSRMDRLSESEIEGTNPYVMEPDLVAGIAYGELGYAHDPDGMPLDPSAQFVGHSDIDFAGEPASLPAELPRFTWPTAVIACGLDIRTPPPIAARLVELIPHAVLVELADTGHSALDSHREAAVEVIRSVRDGDWAALPARSAELTALPRRGSLHILSLLVRAGIKLSGVLP